MNVGQIFECLLGLCGKLLKEKYIYQTFINKHSKNTSDRTINNKLLKTSRLTKKKWVFDINNLGKTKIFNGKTGESFEQQITIGYSYIIKLMHIASEKKTTRTIGSYSTITKQPLKGKSKKGGQRLGEMEIWAIEGFGSSYILQEALTIKSDDIRNRYKLINNIIRGNLIASPNIPESFKILILQIKSIGINVNIYKSRKVYFNE